MAIKCENNQYFELYKNQFSSDQDIFDYVKNSLKFDYSNLEYKVFQKGYSEQNWLGRKIYALPQAFLSGIVKSIYHLGKAVMSWRSHDKKAVDAYCFHIRRDFQESLGWLATIFNDSFGQYHVQKSQFLQSCYDYFLAHRKSVA